MIYQTIVLKFARFKNHFVHYADRHLWTWISPSYHLSTYLKSETKKKYDVKKIPFRNLKMVLYRHYPVLSDRNNPDTILASFYLLYLNSEAKKIPIKNFTFEIWKWYTFYLVLSDDPESWYFSLHLFLIMHPTT